MRNVRSHVRLASVGIAIAVVASLSLVAPAIATSSAPGDVSDAMIYGADGPIGSIVPGISIEDDADATVASAFPINAFGTKYSNLCISSNGFVVPVAELTDGCNMGYNQRPGQLAHDAEVPVIAALANDLQGDRLLWKTGVGIASIESTGGVTTVTTASPQDLSTGLSVHLWLGDNQSTQFNGSKYVTLDAVQDVNHFSFVSDFDDSGPVALEGAYVSDGIYSVAADDIDGDGYADDGFGAIGAVYAGSTTINGRLAEVITWYRMRSNDGVNDPSLSQNFQIVLLQNPTADPGANGYDFTIQFNYGSIADKEDGYRSSTLTQACDAQSHIELCRWGAGWATYDIATDTVTSSELFPDSQIGDLIDGSSTAITSNSLNSPVLGRYTFSMIGGQTVGFVAPTMGAGVSDGGDIGGGPLPDNSSDDGDPLAAVPVTDQPAGTSSLTVAGAPATVTITPNTDKHGVTATGPGFTVGLKGTTPSGTALSNDAAGHLVLEQNGFADVSGDGFAPDSPVKIYIFSTATQLGSFMTDSNGHFASHLRLPSSALPGVHTLQVNGYLADGSIVSLNLAAPLDAAKLAATGVDAGAGVVSGTLILLLGAGLLAVSRRRRIAVR
jgi:hypothetical protein